uniref:Secreted protein n=1 Tax=Mesocestoides corti TaxID=53468 RepID=A0A0R3UCS4_MESCO
LREKAASLAEQNARGAKASTTRALASCPLPARRLSRLHLWSTFSPPTKKSTSRGTPPSSPLCKANATDCGKGTVNWKRYTLVPFMFQVEILRCVA